MVVSEFPNVLFVILPVNLGDPGLPLVDVDVDDGALDEELKALPHLGALLLALGHAQLQSRSQVSS